VWRGAFAGDATTATRSGFAKRPRFSASHAEGWFNKRQAKAVRNSIARTPAEDRVIANVTQAGLFVARGAAKTLRDTRANSFAVVDAVVIRPSRTTGTV